MAQLGVDAATNLAMEQMGQFLGGYIVGRAARLDGAPRPEVIIRLAEEWGDRFAAAVGRGIDAGMAAWTVEHGESNDSPARSGGEGDHA